MMAANRPVRRCPETPPAPRHPLWIQLLFRPSGKPKKLLRRVLFHKNGKPRGIFQGFVLHPDGRPYKPFLRWFQSEAYQTLPRAMRLPFGAQPSLSQEAQHIYTRIAARRAQHGS